MTGWLHCFHVVQECCPEGTSIPRQKMMTAGIGPVRFRNVAGVAGWINCSFNRNHGLIRFSVADLRPQAQRIMECWVNPTLPTSEFVVSVRQRRLAMFMIIRRSSCQVAWLVSHPQQMPPNRSHVESVTDTISCDWSVCAHILIKCFHTERSSCKRQSKNQVDRGIWTYLSAIRV